VFDFFWLGNTLICVTHGRGMFQIDLTIQDTAEAILAGDINGTIYAVDAASGADNASRSESISNGKLGEILVADQNQGLKDTLGSLMADNLRYKAFLGDDAGNVFCIDLARLRNGSASVVWSQRANGAADAMPVLWLNPVTKNMCLLVPADSGDLHCFDPFDGGKPRWAIALQNFTQGTAVRSCTVVDKWAYITTDGGVWAVNLLAQKNGVAYSGAEAWERTDIPSGHRGLVVEDRIYVCDKTNSLYALDTRTKALVWSHAVNVGGMPTTQPVWMYGAVIVGTQNGRVTGFNHLDGTELFSFNVQGNIMSISADDTDLYVATAGLKGRLYKYQVVPGQGRTNWAANAITNTSMKFGSGDPVLVVGDKLYINNTTLRQLLCLHTSDLRPVWQSPFFFKGQSFTKPAPLYSTIQHRPQQPAVPPAIDELASAYPPVVETATVQLFRKLMVHQAEAPLQISQVLPSVAQNVVADDQTTVAQTVMSASPATIAQTDPANLPVAMASAASATQQSIRATANEVKLAMVLDYSGSMSSYFDILTTDAITFMYSMRAGENNKKDWLSVTKFSSSNTVVFADNGRVKQLSSQVVQSEAENVMAATWSGRDYATAMSSALQAGANTLTSITSERAIVLFTDGKPFPEPVSDALATGKRLGIPIFAVGLGGVELSYLHQLCGPDRVNITNNIDDIPRFFNQILGDVGVAHPVTNDKFDIPGYHPFTVSGDIPPGANAVTVAVTWSNPDLKYTRNYPPEDGHIQFSLTFGTLSATGSGLSIPYTADPIAGLPGAHPWISYVADGSASGRGYAVFKIKNAGTLPVGVLAGPIRAVAFQKGSPAATPIPVTIGIMSDNAPASIMMAASNQIVRAGQQNLELASVLHRKGISLPATYVSIQMEEPIVAPEKVIQSNRARIDTFRRTTTAFSDMDDAKALIAMKHSAATSEEKAILNPTRNVVLSPSPEGHIQSVAVPATTPGVHTIKVVMRGNDPETGLPFQQTRYQTYLVY
jgi:outer membrane protein assembly factor BamB